MLFLWLLLLRGCMAFAATTTTFNQSKVVGGVWAQMYSNRYVQENEEIGWKCVMVNVTSQDPSTLRIDKYAWRHGNRSVTVHKTLMWRRVLQTDDPHRLMLRLENETQPILFRSGEGGGGITYRLRDFKRDDYLLWTSEDDMSLYVWARNAVDFKVNFDWIVLEKYTFWNYTGYYRFPLPSYSFQCMVRDE